MLNWGDDTSPVGVGVGVFGWCGVFVGLVLGFLEYYCVAVDFDIRLPLGWFHGLCTLVFSS